MQARLISYQGTWATVKVKNGENCDRTDPSTLQFPRWPPVFPGPFYKCRANRSDKGLGSTLRSHGRGLIQGNVPPPENHGFCVLHVCWQRRTRLELKSHFFCLFPLLASNVLLYCVTCLCPKEGVYVSWRQVIKERLRGENQTQTKDEAKWNKKRTPDLRLSRRRGRVIKPLNIRVVGKPATWKWCLQHLLKDRSNRDEEPGVVYRLTCNDCDQTYIGETGRTAITRAKEYASYVRNGRFDMSAAADHAIIHQHSLSFKTVQIVDHEPRAARRRVKEALHIRTEKNPMNKDKGLELDPIWFSVVWIFSYRDRFYANFPNSEPSPKLLRFFHMHCYTVPFFFVLLPSSLRFF